MITSQITARPVFGQDPAGFTPLVPNNSGTLQYFMTATYKTSVLMSAHNYGANVTASKDNLLTEVKTDLDTNYLPSILTDATKSYDVEIMINNITFDFDTPGPDRSIWSPREYQFKVDVVIKVNVN